jgi:FMN phosphatase YigB (HAD superfamily)
MKHKLIVFDIDETLFNSIEAERGKSVKVSRHHKLQHGKVKYYAYRRPHLEAFMRFIAKHFEYIGLWTHGDSLWLSKFIKHILPNNVKLLFTYSYEDSEPYKGNPKDRIKPLSKIYQQFGHLGINERNTLMIEDTKENCRANPLNCIIVPEFLVHENPDDITLPLLAAYIQSLSPRQNIQKQLSSKWREKTLQKLFRKGLKLDAFL